MKKLLKPSLVILFVLILTSCSNNKATSIVENKSLKTAYEGGFYIGVAINEGQILERDSIVTNLITNEFNSITAENIMKSMYLHPAKDTFDFKLADKFVAFGEKNNMYIVGHTLIWHSQLAPWMTQIKDSTEMAIAMDNHIQTIVGHYKGKIDSWDVVNEALNDDGTLRNSVFLSTMGESYLAYAFKLAAEADPEAALYYNDYSMTNPAKRDGAIALVKNLQEKGVKVDGIGMQGHWGLSKPSIEDIEESILAYANLGVKVAITELDIAVLPNPWDLEGAEVSQNFEGSEKMNPYPTQLPDSVQTQLTERYQAIFKLFIKHKDKISRVTFWGVGDGYSWLNNWPIRGRTNYPLLFDRELKAKPAYDSIIALKPRE
jgi:endo-1,4-beta-xylanase